MQYDFLLILSSKMQKERVGGGLVPNLTKVRFFSESTWVALHIFQGSFFIEWINFRFHFLFYFADQNAYLIGKVVICSFFLNLL